MRKKQAKMIGLAVFLCGVTVWSFGQTDTGLVAYWPLDSAESGTTPDVVGGFDFTLNNLSSEDLTTGFSGQSFEFHHEDEQFLSYEAEEGEPLPIANHNSYSVTLWVNAPDQEDFFSRSRVFSESRRDDSNPLFNIAADERMDGPGMVSIFIRPGPPFFFGSTGTAFDDNWHHIAWVDEEHSGRLYVDGELSEIEHSHDDPGFELTTTSVGAVFREEPSHFFTGRIDEVALWNTALTPGQVESLAGGAVPTDEELEPGPPEILTHPEPIVTVEGETVTFLVDVAGEEPFSYEWFKDGEMLPEETARELTIEKVGNEDTGSYQVIVSNPAGSVSSEEVSLEVVAFEETDAGLMTYWPLDEVQDGETPDMMGNFDLTANGMSSENVAEGVEGNGLEFDGTEEFLSVTTEIKGAPLPIYNRQNYSVSMWVKGEGEQSGNRIFAEGYSQNDNPLFTLGTDNTGESDVLEAFLRGNPAGPLDRAPTPLSNVQSENAVFDQEWHHIAWVDRAGEARLYIDGQLDETDFSYDGTRVTLDSTAIGAILRSEAGNFFEGSIDEVSLWTQALTAQQVETLADGEAPPEVEPTEPEIVRFPEGTEELTRGRTELRVTATGTGPFDYQWFKDGNLMPEATSSTLRLADLTSEDAGNYSVQVSNAQGTVESSTMELVVEERPAPPEEIAIDINARGFEGEEHTQEGFESYTITGEEAGEAGEATGIITSPTTRIFNGVEVTISSTGSFGYDDRLREGEPGTENTDSFTEAALLQDLVFPNTQTVGEGLEIRLDFLKPNQFYKITVWSFEPLTIPLGFSNWFANGEVVKEEYLTQEPQNNNVNQFSFNVSSDSQGTIRLEALQGDPVAGSFGVRLNAIRLRETIAPLRIVDFSKRDSDMELVVETQFPEREHQVEVVTDLGEADWSAIEEATFTQTGEHQLETQFAVDSFEDGHAVFRVINLPPAALFATDFEEGAEGWSEGGDNSNWELGDPTGGPGEAGSGENVWATGLDEPYPLSADTWLRSPEIDLTGVDEATLTFWEWRHVEPPPGDVLFHFVEVNVLDADNPEEEPIRQLLRAGGAQMSWQERSFVLGDDILGNRVILEFRLVSDSIREEPLPGWFIDDVSILPE